MNGVMATDLLVQSGQMHMHKQDSPILTGQLWLGDVGVGWGTQESLGVWLGF